MWYVNGLNKYLSDNGFVHFMTKQEMSEDFKEGRAFFFDSEKKEFGLSDMICSDGVEEAHEMAGKFRKSGTLGI